MKKVSVNIYGGNYTFEAQAGEEATIETIASELNRFMDTAINNGHEGKKAFVIAGASAMLSIKRETIELRSLVRKLKDENTMLKENLALKRCSNL